MNTFSLKQQFSFSDCATFSFIILIPDVVFLLVFYFLQFPQSMLVVGGIGARPEQPKCVRVCLFLYPSWLPTLPMPRTAWVHYTAVIVALLKL